MINDVFASKTNSFYRVKFIESFRFVLSMGCPWVFSPPRLWEYFGPLLFAHSWFLHSVYSPVFEPCLVCVGHLAPPLFAQKIVEIFLHHCLTVCVSGLIQHFSFSRMCAWH